MTDTTIEQRGIARFSWILHAAVTAMVALSGVYLLSTPDERNVGLLSVGFAILGILLSVGAFRQGKEYAWTVMWVYPVTFGALAISIMLGGDMGVGGYYLALAVLGSLAQIVSANNFKTSN